ncbi:nonsense-mediated mRNA decay factor SMG5 isoform X2 [Gadus chalcogrammus]|uniref:nonsense-mediated mRNA decay factor SMG5 isoform X1 n=1 Tax=Gadus chalcogrammus TaxID=1042646 RepID=UPI0024C4D2F8|nr:nonsense-mediated mRNA decay factor SMG5 isoform X1 [Gadus chalcogrammus]XP_056457274.1 nonsense-mediated mRNA decay factor SMG5 isoform X2 [Gadus chalcogrammus]
MSGPGQDSEPEAKVLHIKRLYRAVVESVHKLDVIIGSKSSYREVFKPENISLRNKLRELCVKLMFLHPVDYGRKAEELLWRKVYYEVIQVIKTNKKHIHSRSALECAYRTHLIAGVGFYQHLLLYIQSHYQLELQDCIDWTHVTDPLIGRKKPVSASPKEMEWAQMACHRCLVYLGDLARYQNELAGVEAEQLAERFYHQALSVTPHVGMPFNQLGTLAGSKFYNVEATYYYLRCIQSETPFEGAYGNLKRLFDKASKMYQQVKKQEMKKLSPSRQRSRDIKRLLVSFMYLQSLLQPKSSLMEAELTSLCQSVLEDFNLVLFYLPPPPHSGVGPHLPSVEEEEEEMPQQLQLAHNADPTSPSPTMPDALVFKMVVTCLMVVHSLKRGGSKQYSASIAFTLALFSHLVNHVNIRLQAELEDGESQVPALQADNADDQETQDLLQPLADPSETKPLVNGSLAPDRDAQKDGEKDDGQGLERKESGEECKEEKEEQEEKRRQKKKYTRLSHLRRRRCGRKDVHAEDESDLSEGFESDEEDEEEEEEDDGGGRSSVDPVEPAVNSSSSSKKEVKRDEVSWATGSEEEEEEEEGGTAFDVETDSDMNSQESRSDLEDMEEAESSEPPEGRPRPQGPRDHGEGHGAEEQKRQEGGGDTPPATNGPLLPGNDASIISSNLQAMSSQLFQAKRSFRLAPTFSNMLLRPPGSAASASPASAPTTTASPTLENLPTAGDTAPSDVTPHTVNGTNEIDLDSDSEGSQHSNPSACSEKTLSEKMQILTTQGLIQVVKVFIDWLRTNTDIILMCAQSSQSLWNRLSVLLNLLPDGSKMLEAELGLSPEVAALLGECEQPGLVQSLLLPEDLALRHLPALGLAHRRLDYSRPRPALSPLQECVVRVCCIRSFGHFLTSLQGNVLHFNPEAGIFTSISQSEQDNLVQQAKAQFRMAEEEARRNRLMRDMAQLRLQLEVSQLEGSLQQPKAQSSMSPYLVPDTAALCQHLNLIRQLASSGCFIVIIPRTVIDGLDMLKKENAGARDSIRFLESEFRKGNRYIRCQKETGRSFERDKLKRQDIEAWHLYKMVDSCRQLTISQSNGDDDTAGMVTILTGHAVEELSSRSATMKAAVQAASAAGMELKNMVEFYRQWKEIG